MTKSNPTNLLLPLAVLTGLSLQAQQATNVPVLLSSAGSTYATTIPLTGTTLYYAQSFKTDANQYDVFSVDLPISVAGGGALGDVQVAIYADSTGQPGTAVIPSTSFSITAPHAYDPNTAAAADGNGTSYTRFYANPARLAPGTQYWIVVTATPTDTFLGWDAAATATYTGAMQEASANATTSTASSTDGSTWSAGTAPALFTVTYASTVDTIGVGQGTHLYWSNPGGTSIGRSDADGANPEDSWIITPTIAPGNLAVSGNRLFWGDYDADDIYEWYPANLGASFDRVATTATVGDTMSNPVAAGNYLYWVYYDYTDSQNPVYRIAASPLDKSAPPNLNYLTPPLGNLSFIHMVALAVDPSNQYIYWTDTDNQTIGVARLTGTLSGPTDPATINANLLPLAHNAQSLTADSNYLYWGDASGFDGNGSIGRAPFSAGLLGAAVDPWLNNTILLNETVAQEQAFYGLSNITASATGIYFSNTNTFDASSQAPPSAYGTAPIFFFNSSLSTLTQVVTTATPTLVGYYASSGPLVIDLASFAAVPAATGVTLAWTTGAEINNAGFNVLRSTQASGGFAKVNGTLIASKAAAPAGASYTWSDPTAVSGKTYYYELQDVDTSNVATLHGPVAVNVGPAAIQSFQASPQTIFAGGKSTLTWSTTGNAPLHLNTVGAVAGSSQTVAPAATRTYQLQDAYGNSNSTTVAVVPFLTKHMSGLAKAWGSSRGDANFNAMYDVNGDGKVDDADVAILLNSGR